MPSSFDVKALGEVIARALGAKPGDTLEVQRDKLNPNRVMVLRVVNEPGPSA